MDTWTGSSVFDGTQKLVMREGVMARDGTQMKRTEGEKKRRKGFDRKVIH